jgi:hypothetical protein
MPTFSPTFRRLPHTIATCLALLGALLLLTACGSTPTKSSMSSTLPTPTRDTPERTPLNGDGSGDGWRTDLKTGDVAGQAAEATVLVLEDGSTATLEELADGKPLLLYFFATW